MKKRNINVIVSILALFFILTNCVNQNQKDEHGYVLFRDPDLWYFVSANEITSRNYLTQFVSDNLGVGTQFPPYFKGKNLLVQNLDTLTVDDFTGNKISSLSTLKIVPVHIIYEIRNDKIASASIFEFECKTQGTDVSFKFNVLPINIKYIEVIND